MTMILEKNRAEGNNGSEEVLMLGGTNTMLTTRLDNIEKQNNENESKDATNNENLADRIKTMSDKADKNLADLIQTMSDKDDIREAERNNDETKRDAEATTYRQDQESINSKVMASLDSIGIKFKEVEASISNVDAESPSKS